MKTEEDRQFFREHIEKEFGENPSRLCFILADAVDHFLVECQRLNASELDVVSTIGIHINKLMGITYTLLGDKDGDAFFKICMEGGRNDGKKLRKQIEEADKNGE